MRDKDFLIIGLGSMGKRRIKNLQELGYENIFGFDIYSPTQEDVCKEYYLQPHDVGYEYDAVFICTPPKVRKVHLFRCINHNEHCFIESGYYTDGIPEAIKALKGKQLIVAPSCSMRFNPTVKALKKKLLSGELGEITNVLYHSGKYLPDWGHGDDFYVKDIGAGYLLPFELSWLQYLFGKAVWKSGSRKNDKTAYNTVFKFDNLMAVVTVDITSRTPIRRLLINSSEEQLIVDIDITEQMYLEETKAFLDAIDGGVDFPNTLEKELTLLKMAEEIG